MNAKRLWKTVTTDNGFIWLLLLVLINAAVVRHAKGKMFAKLRNTPAMGVDW